ncbi:hypothetical protein AYI68_g8397 [Smittium mucronatum]|uniref:Uncharacterized protein n=1 Tax=Smittium mucronatum TaxID=133383 RepID=A0A1R0GL13_9FUNG|nr:hypothetical protein AYI68_g8397 [Smittium mucronatum]
MGAICCKPINVFNEVTENSRLLSVEEPRGTTHSENPSYEELVAAETNGIHKEESLLNLISTETANELFDISSKPVLPKSTIRESTPSADYRILLQFFDSKVDMSSQFPRSSLGKSSTSRSYNKQQFSVLFQQPTLTDLKDLEMVDMASAEISRAMKDFKLDYTGPIFVPFSYNEQTA